MNLNLRKNCTVALCGAALFATAATQAAADDKVSGNFGISYNSHFMSYGADIWGAGDEVFGDRSTTFVTGGVNFQLTDAFSVNIGAWADVNDNANSAIGGNLQEIDVWLGTAYTLGIATVSATYQSWNYAGDVEEILDFGLGIDDSEYLGAWAMSPSVTWHVRTSGNGTQADGSIIQVGVSPGLSLTETVSLSFPAGVGFLLTDDFHGGNESGYGYSYLGASLGVPLTFISEDFGSWSMNFDLIGYATDDKAIPINREENFLTGSVGLALDF